jgi:hypothetical protein
MIRLTETKFMDLETEKISLSKTPSLTLSNTKTSAIQQYAHYRH